MICSKMRDTRQRNAMVWGFENQTAITEFILLGFGDLPALQLLLFLLFLVIYIVTLAGNIVIIALVVADQHLHTPMYFFLGNLSCLETCYTSTILPRMLASLLTGDRTISVSGCLVQLYFFGSLVGTECYLLAAMSYDRYLAICKPLHYSTHMNDRFCLHLAVGAWLSAFLVVTIIIFLMSQLTFCGPNEMDHFFCDLTPVIKLSCSVTHQMELVTFLGSFLFTLPPFLLTLTSYICIITAILRIPSKFILLGFGDFHEMQPLLFVTFLFIYTITMSGNIVIVLVIALNPSLHTPMYFFLVNLSFLEICYTSSVVPQLLVHLLVEQKTITIAGCAAQMYVITCTGLTECCLLAAMAYDRYVAICHPLHYRTIMSGRACTQLAGASWTIGNLVGVAQTTWIFSLPFCGSNRIHHFFCDLPPVLKMACTDISQNKIMVLTVSVLFIMGPFLLIILSYMCIISTIFKLPSVEGRRKAFSTCSSHLMVVTLFYGMGLFTYLRPKSSSTPENDQMVSLVITVAAPVLNPIIYTLRNKEVKGAFRKTVEKSIFSHNWRKQRMKH
uniref:G-protein coupled receptors family 1 profile domain-containing protein n=1 Tax=Chelydra serpentina TaxID=8475 RepID=A0A8C3S9H0_CHESE